MSQKDQLKLLKAGFTIIRDETRHISGINYECKIKAKTPERKDWFVLEKNFPSVAAMVRRKQELLKDNKTVAE